MSRRRSGLGPQPRYRFQGVTGTVISLFRRGGLSVEDVRTIGASGLSVGDSVALLKHCKAYQCTRIR